MLNSNIILANSTNLGTEPPLLETYGFLKGWHVLYAMYLRLHNHFKIIKNQYFILAS